MSWSLLIGLVLVLGIALCAAVLRRRELARMRTHVVERERAVRIGSHTAELQHPVIDLSRCLGCGKCVRSCPEEGVLELVHGQAVVVNGARCTGVAACERECPVGAIRVTLTNLEERRDVPALTDELEAVGTPGLFLAGEVTAHALIKTAIDHGTAVAATVARRCVARRDAVLPISGQAGEEQGRSELATAASSAPRSTLRSSIALQRTHGMPERLSNNAGGSRSTVTLAAPAIEDDEAAAHPLAWLLASTEAGPAASSAREPIHDLVIVGAGPAGLACALEAKRRDLDFVVIDQDASLGGTVAKYPRRKLVLMQPVELPLHGRLERRSYTKEELIELWTRIAAEHALPIRHGEVFLGVERSAHGIFRVTTRTGAIHARHVCIAIGRRGTPMQLGVPGEDLSKVAYSLLDARSYQGRRILVVGGGDSAVETALALAEQPGNTVAISYRREGFFRIRARNEERLNAAIVAGKVAVILESRVVAIHEQHVDLEQDDQGTARIHAIANDDVFVMAGGVAPFPVLERSGVSFDPAVRAQSQTAGAMGELGEQGTGLVRALAIGFGLALAALAWALVHADYYVLTMEERPAHAKHTLLRPGLGAGLALGIVSLALVVVNLLYLARRAEWWKIRFGTLRAWMTGHVATGILALLAATLHGGMAPRDTVGGHALWAMVVLFVSGAIGRYFYACIPRAANGRELALEEVKLRLARLARDYDAGQRAFVDRVRAEIDDLVARRQWKSTLVGRIAALAIGRRDLRRLLSRLEREGRAQGVPHDRVAHTLSLGREAHRMAVMAAQYEDLRALLNTWRYVHRWVALLLVVLVALHVAYALLYGFSGGMG